MTTRVLSAGAAAAVLVSLGLASVVWRWSARPESSELRVGYCDFPPFLTAEHAGTIGGFAVEVLNEAARRSGTRLRWVPIDNPESAIERQQIDVYPILTVNSERSRRFAASQPWWESMQSLLSPRDRPLANLAQVVGRRIGLRSHDVVAFTALSGVPGVEIQRSDSDRELMASLCQGRLDGILEEGRLLHYALLTQPGECAGRAFTEVPLPSTASPMATFARPGAARETAPLFDAIERIAMDGTLTELANAHLSVSQQRIGRDILAARHERRMARFYMLGAALLTLAGSWFCWAGYRMRDRTQMAWARAHRAEAQFEAFMAHSPALAVINDAEGHVVWANPATSRIPAVAPEQAMEEGSSGFRGQLASPLREHDEEVLATGQPVQFVARLTVPGSAGLHLLLLKFPVEGANGERLIGTTGIDVSAQQTSIEQVEHSEERYRLLFEDAPVAFHEIDRDGIITRINKAGCELGGYTKEESIGRYTADFLDTADREMARSAVRAKLVGTVPSAPVRRTYMHKSGRKIPVEVHYTLISDASGAVQGARTCLLDLTEREEARRRLDAFAEELRRNNQALAEALEAAREATKLKSQFLANMSHEIRTPLNGVLGLTELLVESGLTAEQQSMARSVEQSGRHLLKIIDDILAFSSLESGKLAVQAAPFSPAAIVETVVALVGASAHAKQLELTCFVDPAVPSRLRGDEARLRQVLLNLAGNAVKFTERGEVSIQVTLSRDADGSEVVRFSVSDTGIGIAPATVSHIFTSFSQADASSTRRFGGTGLGLAISKGVVELLGGKIGVESQEGCGSTFWFTIRPEPGPAEPAVPLDPLPPARILIVDDSATSRSILERYATAWGMRAAVAAGGPEALAIARERHAQREPFEVALIDAQMPGMIGSDVAAAFRADAVLSATRIVLLTTLDDILTPASDIPRLEKPVQPRALRECLRRLLAPSPAAGAPPGTEPAQPSPMRGRVLIAEDNPVNQRVVRLQVQRLGFEPDVVGDGEEALAALANSHYTLVLMDCQMPRMDGYQATRELRRREGASRHTPVIAVTANALAADREACLAAGMDDHLPKPVNLHALGEILARWSSAA